MVDSAKTQNQVASGDRKQIAYSDAVKAVNYAVLFDDMAIYFEGARMPVVSHHLSAASREIDRIWAAFENERNKEAA